MAIDKEKLLDPIDLELQSKYQELGITYLSNNNSVVNRDSAGNVVLIENESNPLLIIQPVVKQLINRSVIKVIDTQFNYFKFPVRVIQSPIDLDLDADFGTDASYARYKPPYGYGEGEIPFNATSYDPVDFSEVVEGLPQISPSSYTISKEIDANHSINGGQSYWVITDAAKNVDLWNQEVE